MLESPKPMSRDDPMTGRQQRKRIGTTGTRHRPGMGVELGGDFGVGAALARGNLPNGVPDPLLEGSSKISARDRQKGLGIRQIGLKGAQQGEKFRRIDVPGGRRRDQTRLKAKGEAYPTDPQNLKMPEGGGPAGQTLQFQGGHGPSTSMARGPGEPTREG